MKAYLLSYNPIGYTQKDLIDYLNMRPEVLNWMTGLFNAVIIISDSTATELVTPIRSRFPAGWMLLTEIVPSGTDGWLPRSFWEFIQNPKSVKRSTLTP
jgi:hypothetical protein